MIKKYFRIPPTELNLQLLIGSHKQCVAYLKKEKIDCPLPWSEGCFVSQDYKYYLFLNEELYNAGTVVHEIVHASWFISENCNLIEGNFTFNSQELQAYIVSTLYTDINNYLTKLANK